MYSSAAEVYGNEERKIGIARKPHDVTSIRNLSEATIGKEYIIKEIDSDDRDLKNFLFTLGCFAGESVTVMSVLAENFVIVVKDARYSIDADLARVLLV